MTNDLVLLLLRYHDAKLRPQKNIANSLEICVKIEHHVFFVKDVGPPVLQHVDGMQKP